eukprot:2587882-Lingulodinium_polyedra.AAC.1
MWADANMKGFNVLHACVHSNDVMVCSAVVFWGPNGVKKQLEVILTCFQDLDSASLESLTEAR